MKQLLLGHVGIDTAFVQDDYPYGRTLRCQRRVWVETKKGFGQRLVTQTNNPKNGRWNKPHPGQYSALVVLYLDSETNHVEHAVCGVSDSLETIEEFAAEYAEALTGIYAKGALEYLRALRKVTSQIKWEVTSYGDPQGVKVGSGEHQSPTEQAQVIHDLTVSQIVKDRKGS